MKSRESFSIFQADIVTKTAGSPKSTARKHDFLSETVEEAEKTPAALPRLSTSHPI
jgi:hypothetical protein